MTALPTSLQRSIKEQIRNKLDSITTIQSLYTFAKIPPAGFPAVFVLNGNMEGEFWSTSEDKRIYAYRILVLYQIGQSVDTISNDRVQEAEEIVGNVCESIMNTLDTDFQLDQFNANVVYLDAIDMVNNQYGYEGGWAYGAEMTVRVHTMFTV